MKGRQSGDPFAALLRIVYTQVDRGKGKNINRDRQGSRQAADKQYRVTGGDQGRRQTNTVQYTGKVQCRQQRITKNKQSNGNQETVHKKTLSNDHRGKSRLRGECVCVCGLNSVGVMRCRCVRNQSQE